MQALHRKRGVLLELPAVDFVSKSSFHNANTPAGPQQRTALSSRVCRLSFWRDLQARTAQCMADCRGPEPRTQIAHQQPGRIVCMEICDREILAWIELGGDDDRK